MIAELVAEFQTATTSCCDINHCMLASELEQGLELGLGLRLELGLEQGLGLELGLRLELGLEQGLGLELGLRLERQLEQELGLELRLEQGLVQQQTAQPSCSGRYPVLLHVIFGQLIYYKQKQVHRG